MRPANLRQRAVGVHPVKQMLTMFSAASRSPGWCWAAPGRVYANVFGASIYPTLAGGNFDAPVIRHKQSVAARTPQAIVNNVFAALPEPAPVIAAPATIASTSTLKFDDRFAAAAPQGVAPKPQAETMQLASASPSVEVTKPVDAPKLLEAAKPKQASPAPAQVAALTPAPAETKPPRARVLPSRTWRSAPRRR